MQMASLESIKHIIAPDLERLNIRIREKLISANPMMNRVINSFLETKGKQIRPIIVLLTARMLGNVNDNTLSAAAAVELLHNASLIHDDVVDNSMLRRGVPTINAIWDNHIAVLVGDFFVSTAMQQAISTDDVRIIDALCFLGKLLSLGELDQIYNARYHQLSEDGYFRIINYKTASLFVACAKMGCYSVNAPENHLDVVTRFAELLGLCFQIRDDIFDYFPCDKVGKPTGNDLKEGKITLPLLHTLLDDSLPESAAMRALAYKDTLSVDEIDALIKYAIENGGIDYAYDKMSELRDQARGLLLTLPENEAREALLRVLDSIITREF